ncbi:MAG: iron donor protein CyaY [Deltaproteobacteria bacterium]|nr:iron donor protein CyaY [Deltaproteobacteria bacterium]
MSVQGEQIPEAKFEGLAERTLATMVEALASMEEESMDADLESGVLTIAFDDGTRFVVNSHRAARQIWMAANARAWHFDWEDVDGGVWKSSKDGAELWSLLESHLGAKLHRTVCLRPPTT